MNLECYQKKAEPDENFQLIRERRPDTLWYFTMRHIPTGEMAGPIKTKAKYLYQLQGYAASALRSQLCHRLALGQPMYVTKNWTGCIVPPPL